MKIGAISRRPKGYRLSLGLASDAAEQFPELRTALSGPLVAVVELGPASRLNLRQLARDLHGQPPVDTVVTRKGRAGDRQTSLLSLSQLRAHVDASRDAAHMDRLERSYAHQP
ncbi:hypothetical protein AB0G83_07645 [Streptomyces klenkii]|uniref:hypothetical protein n=1 Tax=Streptomyces klenkii TaxID=1420899 RepID=UPI0033ED3CF3